MQYLSEEWITAADAALAAAFADLPDTDAPDSDAGSTTIGYLVNGAPTGKVHYYLFAGPDGAGVASGKPDEADATMELDYDTAVAVAQGQTAAQVAFMQGRLKLAGNVLLLIDGAKRLEAVSSALAGIAGVEY